MTLRLAIVPALVLLCCAPSFGQDKDKQIQELRKRLSQSEDQLLELARKFDMEKKRLQDEKEALLKEVARLKKENAILEAKVASMKGKGGEKKKDDDSFLDEKKITLNFNETPLSEVVMFLQDITGTNFVLSKSVPDDAVVSLRVRDLTLRQALDLLCAGASSSEGDCELMWRFKSGVVQIAKKKTKKKN